MADHHGLRRLRVDERDRFDALHTAGMAEAAVGRIRTAELVAAQQTAGEAVEVAYDRAAVAQAAGDPDGLAAAQARLQEVRQAFDRTSRQVTTELAALAQARHARTGQVYEQLDQLWQAQDAEHDAQLSASTYP